MTTAGLFQNIVSLWAVVDPVGSIPVFIAATAGMNAALKRKVALRAVLMAFLVLFGFMVGGQLLLEALDIQLEAFQIAGGLVLLLFALSLIFADSSKPEKESEMCDGKEHALDISVFPLAVPSIAGPGAMTGVVLATDKYRYSLHDQFTTFVALIIVLTFTYLFFLLANKIQRVIGTSGASIVSRVMGLILASIAVQTILNGLMAFLEGA
ncbi:MarC family protein [Photobacterium makurazakiensis]|uniref:MarC family protein n=1 Tax=Photobacterium TaxID=657 RepID=UPI003D0E82E6